MVDQSLVMSGFDAEVLIGARYLRYVLLSSVETGSFPLRFAVEEPAENLALDITVHPPEDYDRLYEPNPAADPLPSPSALGAFDTRILVDDEADLRLRLVVDIRDRLSGQELVDEHVDLFLSLDLVTEEDAAGAVTSAQLAFEVIDLEASAGILLALALAGKTPDDLLPFVKAEVDRTIDFGVVGASQRLHAVEMRALPGTDGHPPALGVYLNLRLRNGPAPDEFLADRGDLAAARNFLPDGHDLAFAMPASLYDRVGDDALFRMAEETAPGSGQFHFPLREDPADPDSEQKGKITDITVSPRPGNGLRIAAHGEFFVDWLPDPNFVFTFDLTPVVEDGLLRWDVSHDLDVDLLGTFLIHLALVAIIFSLGTSGIIALILLGIQELVVEPIALARLDSQGATTFDASFLDALPHRVTNERRRWDPLYTTEHQAVTLLADGIAVTAAGIAFSGTAVLDKQPDPVGHVVIRDADRDTDDTLVALRYRVHDITRVSADFTPELPATDRLPFTRVQGDVEADLVSLTLAQVRDRVDTGRIRDAITYAPQKVAVRDNQVHRLLCISHTEIGEQRDRLIRDFRARTRARILAERGDELRDEVTEALEQELGQPPTAEQVQEALDARLDELVAEEETAYRTDELPGDLEAAAADRARLDLDSPEYYRLEDDRVLALPGYQRIRMRRDGVESVYYRDTPDGDPSDNLLSLPRYRPAVDVGG